MFNRLKPWLLCFLSAGLLILAFPRTDIWIFAWIGLVPLMIVLDEKTPWAAFRSAYLCGFLFFAGTLYWFYNITSWFSYLAAIGVSLLLFYLALYFGIFGLAYSLFSRRKPLFRLFLLSSVWAALEFARAHLFTGFDWASLGQSQYRNLPIIQMADITGMFGVSFLIVMVNLSIKELITVYFIRRQPDGRKNVPALLRTTAIAVGIVLGYGALCLSSRGENDRTSQRISVAVIQPNIPQDMKWQETAKLLIIAKNMALTKQAADLAPDLIVWPETSYPDYLWEERELFDQVRAFVQRINIPVLLGSVLQEEGNYYNAAILLSKNGEVAGVYRKIHLVPFGEFVPLRRLLPFVAETLDIGDFTRGEQNMVFSSPGKVGQKNLFSVLICFEDTVARLSRGFVQEGAQFLVNITNDAWFADTKAPFMHLQSSVFRAVENRRGLVRAANTGVSCFIDQWGRIKSCVEGQEGGRRKQTYVSGFAVTDLALSGKDTFYTKYGDVFEILCFGCILMGIAAGKKKPRGQN